LRSQVNSSTARTVCKTQRCRSSPSNGPGVKPRERVPSAAFAFVLRASHRHQRNPSPGRRNTPPGWPAFDPNTVALNSGTIAQCAASAN
jgi:hypothetical protein